MKHTRSRSAAGVVLVIAAAVAGCGRRAAVTVHITEPAAGATVPGPKVRVVLEARGIPIAPASEQRAGTAHHHLFLDVDQTPAGDTIPAGVTGVIHLGRGQTEFAFDSVGPGKHRVIAMLADPWHVPIHPLAVDTVEFTVAP